MLTTLLFVCDVVCIMSCVEVGCVVGCVCVDVMCCVGVGCAVGWVWAMISGGMLLVY